MSSPSVDQETQGTSHRLTLLKGQIVHARRCYRRLCFIDLRIDSDTKYTILFRSDDPRSSLDPSLQLTDLQLAVCWKRVKRGDTIQINVFDAIDKERECRAHPVFQAVTFDILQPWPSSSPFPGEPAMGLRNQTPKSASSPLNGNENNSNEGNTSFVALAETSTKTLPTKAETSDATSDASTTTSTGANTILDSWKEYCKYWINSQRCPIKDCRMKHPLGQELIDMRATWVQERSQARKDRSRYEDDPHAASSKVPHSQRAFIFCRWLVETFGVEYLNSGSGVLDIAGGKGEISIFLTHKYGIQSTVVEPKPRRDKRYQRRNLMEVIRKQLDIETGGDGAFYREHTGGLKASDKDASSTVDAQVPSSAKTTQIQDSQVEKTAQASNHVDAAQKEELKEEQSETEAKQAKKREHRRAKKLALEKFVVPRLDTLLDDAFVEKFPGILESCSVLIGMHPDQATEPIVAMALKHNKPFAIVPCCVFAIENPHRRLHDGSEVTTTAAFVQYLMEKDEPSKKTTDSSDPASDSASSCEPMKRSFLPFDGNNQVVFRTRT